MLRIPAQADEATCRNVLKDCDTALNAEIHLNALQKQLISDQDKQHALDESEIHSLESHDSAWYRNPYILFTAGLLAGGYIISQVRR